MKRLFISFVVFGMALCAAATDRFYIEDFTIAAGETHTVNIMLDNETAYTAFQSDLYLPDELSLDEGSFALTERKNANHTLTVSAFPDRVYRMMSYSLNIKTYSGNSGALVTFNVTASEDFEGPVVITLRNTLFTTEAGIEIPFEDETCTVMLPASFIKGDVDGDGNVNISDVTALIDYLLSGNASGINVSAADCNLDGKVNISDVTSLIDYLLSGTWN